MTKQLSAVTTKVLEESAEKDTEDFPPLGRPDSKGGGHAIEEKDETKESKIGKNEEASEVY